MWQCDSCGYIVNGGVSEEFVENHECDERSVIRHAVKRIDDSFAHFLSTPQGQFEVHDAQRRLNE